MTVIACVRTATSYTMAADTGIFDSNTVAYTSDKILRVGNTLVGMSGTSKYTDAAWACAEQWCIDNIHEPIEQRRHLQSLVRAIEKQYPPLKEADDSMEYVVCTGAAIWAVDSTFSVLLIDAPYYAIGSGALGALSVLNYQSMAVGLGAAHLDPHGAVDAVIAHHADAKGPVISITIDNKPGGKRQKARYRGTP